MPCLPTWRRAQLQADLDRIDAQLAELYTAYDSSLTNAEVESYAFDSGEGRQQTKRRSPNEIQDLIDVLESKRDRIQRKLYGQGLVNLSMRRRSHYARNGYGFRGE